MSPNGDAGGALDRLKKKRQDMALVRAQEDEERKTRKLNEDKKFQKSQSTNLSMLELRRESQLAEQNDAAQSAIDSMRKKQEQDLAEFRKRQASELSMLRAEHERKREDIERRHEENKDDVRVEDENRLRVRRKDDETLKRKREEEDLELKDEVYKAFLQDSDSTERDGGPVIKHEDVDTKHSPLEREAETPERDPRASKRHKPNPEPEGGVSGNSSSNGGPPDIDTHFALEAISINDFQGNTSTWRVNDGSGWTNIEKRTLRFLGPSSAFEVCALNQTLTCRYPKWVLRTTGNTDVYYDREIARLAARDETGWLRLQFDCAATLDGFVRLCRDRFPSMKLYGVSIFKTSALHHNFMDLT
jgi:hypothetical protein